MQRQKRCEYDDDLSHNSLPGIRTRNNVVVSPSFSSCLLDQIYGSIDSTAKPTALSRTMNLDIHSTHTESFHRKDLEKESSTTMPPEWWPISSSTSKVERDHNMTVAEWILSEKSAAATTTTTITEKSTLPPPPLPLHPPRRAGDDPDSFFSTTSASSSDSGFGSGFSSETESFSTNYRKSKPKSNSCLFFGPASWPKMKSKPKPIKTTRDIQPQRPREDGDEFGYGSGASPPSSSSSRLKKKAVKIYSQMKQQQPQSPSLKLARYINSIFNKESAVTTTRKRNAGGSGSQGYSDGNFTASLGSVRRVKSEQISPATAVSVKETSVSGLPVRSLIDVPRRRLAVRSLLGEEYLESRGRKDLDNRRSQIERLVVASTDCGNGRTSRRYGDCEQSIVNGDDDDVWRRQVLEEVATELKMNGGDGSGRYWNDVWNRKRSDIGIDNDDNADADEEEGLSCSSSELFELEHLSLIGDDDELPVYETTNL